MAVFDMKKYLEGKNTTQAVLAGQSGSTKPSGVSTAQKNNALNTVQGVVSAAKKSGGNSGNVSSQIAGVPRLAATVGSKAASLKSGSGSSGSGDGGGTGAGVSTPTTDYQSTLNDLYNKVMGYGGYTPSTYTPGVYTPSVYQRTVDTSGTEAMLEAALNDIRGYGDFKYDLNADMLYQQAVDNYTMLGQQAMQDAMGQAAALTGGYGNSYAAAVGNQAYQQYLTQANNLIPQFQQQALNVWQSGYDRLLNDYNAVSQQLANLLNIEGMNFNIWNANESNAANAFSMNEQAAYNSWLANEQNNYNAWQSGYDQLMDQYNLAKDYYATLEALTPTYSGGSGSSGNSSGFWSKAPGVVDTVAKYGATSDGRSAAAAGIKNAAAGASANPLNSEYYKQLAELLKK